MEDGSARPLIQEKRRKEKKRKGKKRKEKKRKEKKSGLYFTRREARAFHERWGRRKHDLCKKRSKDEPLHCTAQSPKGNMRMIMHFKKSSREGAPLRLRARGLVMI